MRTQTVLMAESFLKYCKTNYKLRFWQALLSWSGNSYIYVSSELINKSYHKLENILLDTYYWKDKTQ